MKELRELICDRIWKDKALHKEFKDFLQDKKQLDYILFEEEDIEALVIINKFLKQRK